MQKYLVKGPMGNYLEIRKVFKVFKYPKASFVEMHYDNKDIFLLPIDPSNTVVDALYNFKEKHWVVCYKRMLVERTKK